MVLYHIYPLTRNIACSSIYSHPPLFPFGNISFSSSCKSHVLLARPTLRRCVFLLWIRILFPNVFFTWLPLYLIYKKASSFGNDFVTHYFTIVFTITSNWRRKWQPTPVFLPGKFHGQRKLAGYSPWGSKELATTEHISTFNFFPLDYLGVSIDYNYLISPFQWLYFSAKPLLQLTTLPKVLEMISNILVLLLTLWEIQGTVLFKEHSIGFWYMVIQIRDCWVK